MGAVIPFPGAAGGDRSRRRLQGLLVDLRDQAAHLGFDLQRALAALAAVPRQHPAVWQARSSVLVQAGRLAAVHKRLSAIEDEVRRGDLTTAAPALMEQLFRLRRVGLELRRALLVAERPLPGMAAPAMAVVKQEEA